jgi:hypothetical protein
MEPPNHYSLRPGISDFPNLRDYNVMPWSPLKMDSVWMLEGILWLWDCPKSSVFARIFSRRQDLAITYGRLVPRAQGVVPGVVYLSRDARVIGTVYTDPVQEVGVSRTVINTLSGKTSCQCMLS